MTFSSKYCYVTTPIYYVNDKPHIGHFYSTLAADVLARSMRLMGRDVRFSTGTDEHGQKVAKSAEIAGVPTQDFVDKNSAKFAKMSDIMNSSHDIFVKTTSDAHKLTVVHIWNILESKGHIYQGKYAGWYASRDEAFYADTDLIDGHAPTGAPVEWVEEDTYFFDLSRWQDKLLELYDNHFIYPESRKNEIVSFVKAGLRDLSISRVNVSWGIPVPSNSAHTIYVWIDALTNYLTALGYPANMEEFGRFWHNAIHVVGKDILRFHAVYWPAILMAAGLPLPKMIVSHGWWQSDGKKISKSLGNAIDYSELIDKFGLDQVRYFFMRHMAFGHDGNFSVEALITTTNADLANNIGNLAQRVLSMIKQYCNSIIPNPSMTNIDRSLIDEAYAAGNRIIDRMGEYRFDEALREIQHLSSAGNRYIDIEAPWQCRKNGDQVRMATILYTAAEVIRVIAIHLLPFMPDAAAVLLKYLCSERSDYAKVCWESRIQVGAVVPEHAPLFPRVG